MAESGVYGFRLGKDDAPVRAQIVGLREVIRDLKNLGDDTKNEMKDTHREAAELVVLSAKNYVPFRTGNLAGTLRAGATRTAGYARAGTQSSVPYAGPIHFGWPARRIAPQPFLYQALDSRVEQVRSVYEKRMNELIEKYELQAGGSVRALRGVQAAAGN